MMVSDTVHSSLYFDDGDLVIIASNSSSSPSATIFKVHRTFLIRYSEVFSDMFTVSSETASTETYDGVPFVKVPPDDAAEDVANFLEMVYYAPYVTLNLN